MRILRAAHAAGRDPAEVTLMAVSKTRAAPDIREAVAADIEHDITIVEVSDDLVVKVRLEGACDGCPMSMQTLKNGVEMVVKTRVPAVLEVVAV